MRPLFAVLLGISLVYTIGLITVRVFADYQFENEIEAYWSLSVKASTIERKSQYLDQYVSALEHARLADHDAMFLKHPDNEVAQNMVALKSLQGRMHEIFTMDPSSFAYQQAMQQISGQEQDAPNKVFEGAWFLENHPLLWDWVGGIHAILVICAVTGSLICLCVVWND